MSNERYTISKQYCDGVGDGLRYAYGGTDQYYPSQWENAIKGLKKTLGTKNINANGDYTASADNLDGFSGVHVEVANTYTQADEGKVVDNGALVAQTSKNINSNGPHTTTTNNQVVVAVPNSYTQADEGKVVDQGELVTQTTLNITGNGTYDTTKNNQVIVSTPVAGAALAKIGGSSTISSLSGLYAMGSSTSYFHPVDSNGDDIEINKAQPFEIKCTFRLTEYPVYAGNRCYDLFGSSAHQSYLPRIEMWYDTEMSNPDMSYFFIDVSDTQGHYISFGDANNALTIPLNTDITIVFTFTGSSVTCTLDMGNTHLSETLNNIEFDQYSVGTYPCEFGAIDDYESGSFARIPGSYFNIDQCYVKQGSTKIWGVSGGDVRGALAKLGSSTEIVTISGLYGPMGDAEDDYVVPVNDNRNDVTVNTGQPFEVKCTFRIPSALPTNAITYILGQNGGAPFPSLYVRYSSTDGYYFTIRGSYEDGGTVVNRTANFGTGAVLPTDTDIEAVVTYDGTDLTATVNYGATTLSGTIDNITLHVHSAAKCMLGADLYGTGGLSGISGAYLNIDKCYIKQGSTYLWRAVNESVKLYYFEEPDPDYYTSKAGALLCTLEGRSYYKTTRDPAYMAYYYRTTGFTDVLLVSETESGARFTSGGSEFSPTTVTINGKTWYTSSRNFAMQGDLTSSAGIALKLPNSYASGDAATEALLQIAQMVPVPIRENGRYDVPEGYDGFGDFTIDTISGGDILTGSDAPAASLGSDGDVYLRIMPLANNVNFVEYLDSSGTQYINTGIVADHLTDIVAGVGWKANSYGIGARTGSASSMTYALYIGGAASRSISITKNGDSSYSFDGNKVTAPANSGKIVCKTTTWKNGSEYMMASYYEGYGTSLRFLRQSAFSTTYPQILFGINQAGTITPGTCRIYRVTYYQAGSPIHDYLPCLDGNGVACMWDNIVGEYVYNDGTGDFTYGGLITPDALDPVYYVKKSGAWEVIQQ